MSRTIDPYDYPGYFNMEINAMIIKLPNVRLSFPDLFVPRPFKEGLTPKYKATFLVPKDSPLAKEIDAAILEVAKAKWGAKAEAVLNGIRGNANKFCWQDGNTKAYDGYADMMALSAGNEARPLVTDTNKSPLTADDGKPYSGCYVHGSVEIFAYTNSGNGISAKLRAVRFYRDGAAFAGGAPADENEFDDLADGVDADPLV